MKEGGLRSLGGDAPPPGLGGDLRAIERLPPRVRDDLWEAVAPNLAAQVDPRAGAAMTAFCEARRVSHADLVGPVKACRFLFRRAAQNNLSADDLRADVAALVGEGEGSLVLPLLVDLYARALPALRQELIVAALAEHGNLATGVDFRLDVVKQSQSGVALDTPVVLMTFRYRKGEENKRITLQFLPSLVGELQAICDRIMT